MKCWRFFKKPDTSEDEIPERISLSDKYPLYAITSNKEYAKQFMKERDMSRFIIRKCNMDKEDYSTIANRNRSTVLGEHELLTIRNKYKSDSEMIHVKVIITENEYQTCSNDPCFQITDEYWWNNSAMIANPMLMNKKIYNALRKLDYNANYKIFNMTQLYEVDDDYSAPNNYIDELALFIKVFGNLLK